MEHLPRRRGAARARARACQRRRPGVIRRCQSRESKHAIRICISSRRRRQQPGRGDVDALRSVVRAVGRGALASSDGVFARKARLGWRASGYRGACRCADGRAAVRRGVRWTCTWMERGSKWVARPWSESTDLEPRCDGGAHNSQQERRPRPHHSRCAAVMRLNTLLDPPRAYSCMSGLD